MNEVNWGIIGTAAIADKVGSAMDAANGARLAAIASREAEKAAAWGAERGVPDTYGSYQGLLDDESIDAVYIPLPPSLHMEWTVKAAEKGKHVLCEKPLAVDAEQARTMRDVCRQCGVQLMDGVMWVHHVRTAAMEKHLRTGALGDLRRVTSAFTFRMPPGRSQDIRLRPELGGGSLGDLGYYCVRAILWAFGDLPDRVYATARHRDGVDMNASVLLWFDEDRVASFDCGFDVGKRQWLEIAGTEGSIVCDDFVASAATEGARYWLHRNAAQVETQTAEPCQQEVCMIEEFSAAVRSGTLRPRWAEDALNTAAVCEAIRHSWSTGQKVEMPGL